jgi:5-formyltetrahydrofolate cyclo-ligase
VNDNDALRLEKAQLRAALRAARAALPPELRAQYSRRIRGRVQRLKAIRNARTIFAFISYDAEVDTHPLLDRWLREGRRLAVPYIAGGQMQAVRFGGWEELVTGALGILTPRRAEPDDGPFDIAITPGVGFTRRGERLGYGKGYYDGWFRDNRVGLKIAVAFEAQLVDRLPVHDRDVPVDLIVTEQRVIRTKD